MPLARVAVRCDERQVRPEPGRRCGVLSDGIARRRGIRGFGLIAKRAKPNSDSDLAQISKFSHLLSRRAVVFLNARRPNPHILFRFSLGPVYSADSTNSYIRWRFRLPNDTTGFSAQTRTTTIGTPFSSKGKRCGTARTASRTLSGR